MPLHVTIFILYATYQFFLHRSWVIRGVTPFGAQNNCLMQLLGLKPAD